MVGQKYLGRFSPSRKYELVAEERKLIPFAADDNRFVPDAAADRIFDPAEPDRIFWSFRDADEFSGARSWNKPTFSGNATPFLLIVLPPASDPPGEGDEVRWRRRWFEGTGSRENRATGSAIRTSGRVSCALMVTCLPSIKREY